jgi:hypothetical protein
MQAAIEAIESREDGASSSYRKVAEEFNVNRTTLSRRHQGSQATNEETQQDRQKLSPQQEEELIKYIDVITERGLPPTRAMLQNFASSVAESPCSERWVDRFLHRHKDSVTMRWATGMDRDRHQADSGDNYRLYFDLIHSKMREYNVEPRHTYNMDEKGFLIGLLTRSKRAFSRQLWESKQVTDALQDGSREFVTLLACICADGTALEPSIIFEGMGPLWSAWVESVDPALHRVFMTTSPTGWSNNDIGLAWLEQVFDRATKEKARSSYRLLILDGHSSHVTPEFLDYCNDNKILLAIFPPHSTHGLQPLDVGMFGPLSAAYSTELSQHLQHSQGVLPVKKGDFFPLFWAAWETSFTRDNILSSFEATGLCPIDADRVLQRFNTTTSEQDEDPELWEEGDSSTWRQLRNLFNAAVSDKSTVAAKALSAALHSLQANNEFLHTENQGYRAAIATKTKHQKQSKPLNLQQREEFHSRAVFWSPRKLREARAREVVKQREEEEEQLQKTERKQIREAAAALKKIQKEEAKEQRRLDKEKRDEERAVRAENLRHAREAKQAAKQAATSKKSAEQANKAKRKASHKSQPKTAKKRRVSGAAASGVGHEPAPEPPPKATSSRSNIKPPAKYR